MTLRIRSVRKALLAFAAALALPAFGQDASLKLKDGDHIAILGNTLPDRMQHDAFFDALIYAKYPKEHLVMRNLSASADEVATWHRSENFGTRDEWLAKEKANVIFAFYGFNESFKGDEGLKQFKADLDAFLKETRAKQYDGKSSPRIVLFSPIAAEKNKDPNYQDPGRKSKNPRRQRRGSNAPSRT